MDVKPEQYLEELLVFVKKELDLYTRYAVRLREDGGVRHIYNTKIFKEELQNILSDEFRSMDRDAYQKERRQLFHEWDDFHERAYEALKKGVMLPLEYMMRKFLLTPFERHCVCLAAAPELNREFERMYCFLQDDYKLNYPTLDLCIKMFTMDPVEQKRLIHSAVREKERLQFIFQKDSENVRGGLSQKMRLRDDLREYLFFYESDLYGRTLIYELYVPKEDGSSADGGPEIHPQARERIRRCLEEETMESKQILFLKGSAGSGRKRQVKLAAAERQRTVLFLDLKELQTQAAAQKKERILDAAGRAVLDRAFLCFCHWEALCRDGVWDTETVCELLGKAGLFFPSVFLISETDYPSEEPLFGFERICQMELRLPDMRQRIRLWERFLAPVLSEETLLAEKLAAQFEFTPGMMKEALETAKRKSDSAGCKQIPDSAIYEACRQKISHRLGERADRVNAAYTWEDLVLAKEPKELLKQACAQISFRYRVYEEWGFEQKLAYGRGVTMLFTGPPGTGKTMAAQVIANELNLELYKVDLSGVLSKYIGETQKNLKEIFDEVKKSRSILFFDEADALFGKRVSVSDARDISANAQTAYLLQKMEEYDGITILATNLMQNFDDAYKRRMKYIISFPLPSEEQRKKLWENVFPEQMPLKEDLDLEYLASNFELSGASVKNIALNAAFLAASRQEITGMEHIMVSLRQEYQKAGMVLGKEELKEYYMYDTKG